MKETLKGMFDNRKMTVRMEQKEVDSKVCNVVPCLRRERLTSAFADPRAQLQNHSPSQLGRPQRSRGPAMGPDEEGSDGARAERDLHPLDVEIYELYDANARQGPTRNERTWRRA